MIDWLVEFWRFCTDTLGILAEVCLVLLLAHVFKDVAEEKERFRAEHEAHELVRAYDRGEVGPWGVRQ